MVNLKFKKEVTEAFQDELAYDIVVKHITECNWFEAVVDIHKILEEMRNSQYPENQNIKCYNVTMYKLVDNVFIIIPGKSARYHNTADKTKIYNLFTYHFNRYEEEEKNENS